MQIYITLISNMDQNELYPEVILRKIGTCPVCGKGQMLQGAAGWTCDYFHTLEDKCTFTIFQKYYGYELSEEDAVDLITKGETGIKDLTTREGKLFRGILKRSGDKIKAASVNRQLPLPCPHCGGRVKEVENGYVCERFFDKGDGHCGFWLPKIISDRPVRYQEALDLMQYGRTEVLDGFRSMGKEYSSCLTLADDGTVLIDSRICRCPKCGGTVYAGIKGFNCSNFRNPVIRCDFVIWRVIGKRKTTVDDVRKLCSQGQTDLCTFYTMDNEPYEKSLVLDEQFKVRMV